MRHHRSIISLVVIAAAVAACTDVAFPRADGSRAANRRTEASPSTAASSLDVLARALAGAMRKEETRRAVRDAMRASIMSEHKLVLQEYAATPAGRLLLGEAADAAHQTPEELRARLASLPPLDFYAPFREHRRTWRAGGEILVGGTMDPGQPQLTAFDVGGHSFVLDARDGVPKLPLLILHPAERKSPRIEPQPDTPGSVIQDVADGERSGTLEWRDERGSILLVNLGGRATRQNGTVPSTTSLVNPDVSSCDPSASTCESGGLSAPGDTTFVDYLAANYGDGWGDSEIELRSRYYHLGAVVAQATYRAEGIIKDEDYYPHEPLILRKIPAGSGDSLSVHAVETDQFFDDQVGAHVFVESDRGQLIAMPFGGGRSGASYYTLKTFVVLGWTP